MHRPLLMSAVFVAAAGLFATSPAGRAAQPNEKDVGKIQAALPDTAPAKPKAERKVLIFSRTAGFRHSSIEYGVRAITLMGEKTKAFTVFATEDESFFEPEKLNKFDAVFFLNTTNDCMAPKVAKDATPEQKAAAKKQEEGYKASLKAFVEGGKGLIGVHAATDTYKNWKDFNVMMGGAFDGHPWNANSKVTIKNVAPDHPLNAAFDGKGFAITDEIYQFRADTAAPDGRTYLLTLDNDKTNVKIGKREDTFYPVSWVSTSGKGRTFYCSLGHREDIYWNPAILKHYLAGMQFALGDLDADAKPAK
jgi:hypothetical protein